MRQLMMLTLLVALLTSTALTTSQAAEAGESRMELGVGAALLSRPDYRGSASVSTSAFPVPYAVYRGEVLQVSRDGLIARLFDTDNVRVRLSLSASLPGHGSRDTARQGMPDLLPTFEAGPSLDWRVSSRGGAWELQLPVRAVAAADFTESEGIGWLAFPQLHFNREWQTAEWALEGGFSAGPVFATRRYHRYFYRVEPQYATAQRPTYDPAGGYSGARATAYLEAHRGHWHVGLGISYDDLAGSVMEDSPLVETRHATVLGLGIFYSLWASQSTISVATEH